MNLEDIFSRLDTIHERDGQTDTGRQQVPRLRIASLGKNITATVASLVDTYFRSSWNWNVVLFTFKGHIVQIHFHPGSAVIFVFRAQAPISSSKEPLQRGR